MVVIRGNHAYLCFTVEGSHNIVPVHPETTEELYVIKKDARRAVYSTYFRASRERWMNIHNSEFNPFREVILRVKIIQFGIPTTKE